MYFIEAAPLTCLSLRWYLSDSNLVSLCVKPDRSDNNNTHDNNDDEDNDNGNSNDNDNNDENDSDNDDNENDDNKNNDDNDNSDKNDNYDNNDDDDNSAAKAPKQSVQPAPIPVAQAVSREAVVAGRKAGVNPKCLWASHFER
ncbi:putative uncharacterized protein DDB_G0283431 [Penaeus indicus]|uniref:putative uncharacterized protein DDB_G0283431 n=1 Tax=Penaeus indicus TaxID=29960 RepID=UPI00300DAFA1